MSAVSDRDLPTLQLLVVLLAAFYVVVNITTDVLTLLVSPWGKAVMRRIGGREREWARVLREALRTRRGKVGLTVVAAVGAIAAIGPFVAPHPSSSFVTLPFAPPPQARRWEGMCLDATSSRGCSSAAGN